MIQAKYIIRLGQHTCSPSYSRGRDRDDQGSMSARAKSHHDCVSKIIGGFVVQAEGYLASKNKALRSNPVTPKKKKILCVVVAPPPSSGDEGRRMEV
jgi:hypothetical protein